LGPKLEISPSCRSPRATGGRFHQTLAPAPSPRSPRRRRRRQPPGKAQAVPAAGALGSCPCGGGAGPLPRRWRSSTRMRRHLARRAGAPRRGVSSRSRRRSSAAWSPPRGRRLRLVGFYGSLRRSRAGDRRFACAPRGGRGRPSRPLLACYGGLLRLRQVAKLLVGASVYDELGPSHGMATTGLDLGWWA
jgi:hypothetical protein